MNRNPKERLGSADGRDFEAIREHAFFRSVDWRKLMKKEVEPLYQPKVQDRDNDTSNFDVQFTSEKAVDSYVADSHIQAADSAGFGGFTFVGESALADRR